MLRLGTHQNEARYNDPLFHCAFPTGIEPRKISKRFFAPIFGIPVRRNFNAAEAEK
jgi:hypothetical protein